MQRKGPKKSSARQTTRERTLYGCGGVLLRLSFDIQRRWSCRASIVDQRGLTDYRLRPLLAPVFCCLCFGIQVGGVEVSGALNDRNDGGE